MILKVLTRLVVIATLLILTLGIVYAEGPTTPIISNWDGDGYDKSEPSDEIENLVIHMLKNFTSHELNVPEDQIEIIAIEGHEKLFAGRIRVIENGEEHVLKVNLESNNIWFDNKKVGGTKKFQISDFDMESKQILIDHGIEITDIHTSEIEFNGNKFMVVNGEVDGITTSYSINPNGVLSKGLSSIKKEHAAFLRQQSKTDLKLDKYLQHSIKNEATEKDILKSQKIPVYISVNDAEDMKLLKNYLIVHGKVNKVEIHRYLPGIATDVDVTDLNEIINLDYVSKVYHDAPINIYLDVSVPTVNGNGIPGWYSNDAGSGITVAIIDTGVDDTHPALSGKFPEGNQRDFIDGSFDDTSGHGTHIAGIIASTDETYKGIAPGATLVNAKSLDSSQSMSLAAASIDWAINERGARVIQMSWGEDPIINGNPNWEWGDNNGMHGISRFVDAVVFEEDVVFSSAVSNRVDPNNPDGWVSPPSDAYNVISVGATDDQNTLNVDDDVLAFFSAHGPVGSDGTTSMERHKPDIVAPGANISSSAHDWEEWWGLNPNFVDKSGTSMAAPHVSGAAAVLLADRPGLSSKEVKAILLNTASDITGTRNEIGLGELDVSEAWVFNRNVLTETATEAGQEIFYKSEPSILRSFIKATLVWERHTSSRQTDTPTSTITPISNLDLILYKESDNSCIDSSSDIYDNVEQVSIESDSGTCIIKIKPLILNNNLEEFALAYYGTAEKVTPPLFSSSFTDFENVPLGSTFTLSLNTANYGDILAHDVKVNLNLPEGISLVSGSNPVSLGSISPRDEVKTASWVVRAESLGTKSVDASISSISYGETFNYTSFPSTFDVFENTPPNQPNSFLQWDSIDRVNVVPFGGTINENTIILDGLVFDPDNTEVQLEVEVKPIGTAFIGIPTCISVPEPSDSWAVASCSGLTSGQYHWQARARDSSDAMSPWVSAGGNPETSPDFEVVLTLTKTYTFDADFDEGALVGLEHDTVHDQLQLTTHVSTDPIMWIANAGEDTISKWDTENNIELARYHTWFGPPASHGAWSGPSPSRTAVDADGNGYVANRHFDGKPADVIKILAESWIDRNGNSVMDTSYDANNDGSITPDEMLPMTDTNGNGKIDDNEIQDERIAWVVSVGPANGLGRSLAIDTNDNIWLGLYNTRAYYKISGVDGSILAGPIDVYPNTPYGALVDKNGILWGASLGYTLLKLDTNTNTKLNVYDHSAYIVNRIRFL